MSSPLAPRAAEATLSWAAIALLGALGIWLLPHAYPERLASFHQADIALSSGAALARWDLRVEQNLLTVGSAEPGRGEETLRIELELRASSRESSLRFVVENACEDPDAAGPGRTLRVVLDGAPVREIDLPSGLAPTLVTIPGVRQGAHQVRLDLHVPAAEGACDRTTIGYLGLY